MRQRFILLTWNIHKILIAKILLVEKLVAKILILKILMATTTLTSF